MTLFAVSVARRSRRSSASPSHVPLGLGASVTHMRCLLQSLVRPGKSPDGGSYELLARVSPHCAPKGRQ
jgi:hypothetical protein